MFDFFLCDFESICMKKLGTFFLGMRLFGSRVRGGERLDNLSLVVFL